MGVDTRERGKWEEANGEMQGGEGGMEIVIVGPCGLLICVSVSRR